MFDRGEFVTLNSAVGVVAFTGENLGGDLSDHTGIWFGDFENGVPIVWTVPTEYLTKAPAAILKH